MKPVLVDSSVWIDYFSGKSQALVLNELIDMNVVHINDLILTELLPFLENRNKHELIELLLTLSTLKLAIDWERIRGMQKTNLKKGLNRIGIPDLVILQNAIQHNVQIFSFDKHFKLLQKYHGFTLLEI